MADQGSEGLLSPFLRNRRIAVVRKLLVGTILDVGCGTGYLASVIPADLYNGVDEDSDSIKMARKLFPQHRFSQELPIKDQKYDTIVALAVIEHVIDPVSFLNTLSSYLNPASRARIIVTTPYPSMDWVHDVGSFLGVFSKHANAEHQELLDREKLRKIGVQTGLALESYHRFLFGANQLAVFKSRA